MKRYEIRTQTSFVECVEENVLPYYPEYVACDDECAPAYRLAAGESPSCGEDEVMVTLIIPDCQEVTAYDWVLVEERYYDVRECYSG